MTTDTLTITDSFVTTYIVNTENNIYIKQDATAQTKTWTYNVRFRYTKN